MVELSHTIAPFFAARTGLPGNRHFLEKDPETGTDTGTAAAAAAAAAAAKPAPNPELEQLRAENTAFRKAEADRASAAAAAKNVEIEEAKKAGHTGKVIDTLSTELEASRKINAELQKKLADLEPDANVGRSAREASKKALEERIAKLPADKKALIEEAPDNMRERLLNTLAPETSTTSTTTSTTTAQPKPPGPGGGPPGAGGGAIDFAAALAGGKETWEAAKQRDAVGARAFFENASKPGGANASVPLVHLQGPPAPPAK